MPLMDLIQKRNFRRLLLSLTSIFVAALDSSRIALKRELLSGATDAGAYSLRLSGSMGFGDWCALQSDRPGLSWLVCVVFVDVLFWRYSIFC